MYFVTGPDGRESGPFGMDVLRQWAGTGQLPPTAPIRKEGEGVRPASQLPELAAFYGAKPADPFGGLIPTGNPASLWGYYLGFLGLLPILGIPLIPFCLYKSFQGIRAFNEDNSVRGRTHAIVGVILGVIGICIQLLVVTVFTAVIWRPQ